MKKFISLLQLFFLYQASYSQTNNITVKGRLADTLQKQQVYNATVSLVNTRDSALVAFTRSDEQGNFEFKNLRQEGYRLIISHVNFHPYSKNFLIQGEGSTVDLGKIFLRDRSLLADVTVSSIRPPVVVNGDTLEFNAESFKTRPNAIVEDMLKKMPGVEVDKDGTIRVNGQRINRVMVNGKDFFNGDPKLATRNLPADAIDKVQVYDRQSDQAAFTGVDDGNSEKTINLKLKKDRTNAAFGKASAAAGTSDRYDGQFNLNKFKNGQQLSAIGMINNTSRQGFTIMDMLNFTGQNKRMMGGGGGGRIVIANGNPDEFGLPVQGINNNQGITKTIAGGLNYSDTWRKNTEVNGSYFYNNLALQNSRLTNRQNLLPGNNFTTLQSSNSLNKSESNRANLSLDHKIDSFNSLKITSQLTYQSGSSFGENIYESFIPNDKQLNNGFSKTTTTTEGNNMSNTLLYRHKFNKKGRTLSFNGMMQHNDSRGSSALNSINNYYSNGVISDRDTINQVLSLKSITGSYGGTVTYTEPLSKRSLIELRGFYNINEGSLNRKTFEYNSSTGKHDLMEPSLSIAFKNNYNYGGGGAGFRVQQKNYNFSAGANVQQTTLTSRLTDSAFSVKQSYLDVLPTALFVYNFTRMKNLRFEYISATTAPTAVQLQPVTDVSNPLNIRKGNPILKQEYAHIFSLQFFNANPAKRQNLFAFLNYRSTMNAIVTSDVITPAGVRTSTPVNADGVYNITATAEKGFSVNPLHTRFGIGGNVSYNHGVNFVNGQENNTGNLALSPRLSANFVYKESIDISLMARYTYNQAKYSLQPLFNDEYGIMRYELEATLNLPAGFSLVSQVSLSSYSGRNDGYNNTYAIWNASLSKLVFKSKKGEIKASATDLLKQQNGIDRVANSNFIEDASYQTLKQYFTLGFTYSLQKATTGGPRAVIRTF